MPTLLERRNALVDQAKEIVAAAKADGRDPTPDEVSAANLKLAEIVRMDAELDAKAAGDDLLGKLDGLTTALGRQVLAQEPTLGDHFAKSAAYREMVDRKGVTRFTTGTNEWDRAAVKAPPATTVSTGLGQVQYGGWVESPLLRPTIADLFSSGTLSGTSFTYFQQGTVTGDFGWVAEDTEKPGLSFTGAPVNENLAKLAGVVKISDETAEDVPALVSVINNQLRVRLSLAEEQGLLNGNGLGPNINGLLGRAIQAEAGADTSDNLDAIFRAATKVQTATYLSADGLVINPLDYQEARLGKDANGQYFAGGPFLGAYGNGGVQESPPIWGLRTVVTTAVPKGTAVVGAWKAGGQVFRKGGIRVESTNSDGDDFRFNRIAIRAEERLLLAVYLPLAFVKVTLSTTPPA